MDALFGSGNYLNNIVWKRATAHNGPKRFGRILDHLLLYSKAPNPCWNLIPTPKSEDELQEATHPRMNAGDTVVLT